MAKKINHILVIRLSAMGDVAMVAPVLRTLTQQYPHLKITVLTRGFFAPFFRDLTNVTVFPAEVNGKHKGILGLFKLSKELKKLKVDAIADLHHVLRSTILKTFLFTIKTIQINKGRAEKKALVTGKTFKQLKTTHQRYADVFNTLGFPLDVSHPTFPDKAVLSKKIKLLLGDSSKKLIGIAPFAAHKGKMYPLQLMEVVIKILSKDYKVILFGGGKKEIIILNTFEASFENVVSVADKLSLDEELNLISNLDVMLSMDSGNAHIAAMLGIKVITIWGVTHPYAGFAPYHQPTDFALLPNRKQFPKAPTSIYGNTYPKHYKEASGSILPETIVKKIKSVI